MKRLLELRRAINAKRPKFTRSNAHKRIRIRRSSWRAPKGLQNKEKLGFHGKKAVAGLGYRGPRAVRGLSREGLAPVRVKTVAEIAQLDPKAQCALIARVGLRRRLDLLNSCKEKKITVMNMNVDRALGLIAEVMSARKEKKSALSKRRSEKERSAKKEAKETKKPESEQLDSEEQKEQQRKDLEKVLTKREG